MSNLKVIKPNENEKEADIDSLFGNWRHHMRYQTRSTSEQRINAMTAARTQINFSWMANNAKARKEPFKMMEALCNLIVHSGEHEVMSAALELVRHLILLPWFQLDGKARENNTLLWRNIMLKLGKLLTIHLESTLREKELAKVVQDLLTDPRCYMFIFENLVSYCTPKELRRIVQNLLDTFQFQGLPPGVLLAWVRQFHLRFRNKMTSGLHQQTRRALRQLPREKDSEATKLLMEIIRVSDPSSSDSIQELREIHVDVFLTATSLLCKSEKYLSSLADDGLGAAAVRILKTYNENSKHKSPCPRSAGVGSSCKLHDPTRWEQFLRTGAWQKLKNGTFSWEGPAESFAPQVMAVCALLKLHLYEATKPHQKAVPLPEAWKEVMDYMLLTENPDIASFNYLALKTDNSLKVGYWLFLSNRLVSPDAQRQLCPSMKSAGEILLRLVGESAETHIPTSFIAMLHGGFVSESAATALPTLHDMLGRLELDSRSALAGVIAGLKLAKHREVSVNILVILASVVVQLRDYISPTYLRLEDALTPDSCKTDGRPDQPDIFFDVSSPSAVACRQQMGFGEYVDEEEQVMAPKPKRPRLGEASREHVEKKDQGMAPTPMRPRLEEALVEYVEKEEQAMAPKPKRPRLGKKDQGTAPKTKRPRSEEASSSPKLVSGYKDLLVRCPYFQRMLVGGYASSGKGTEVLPQMPAEILQVIFHLFYGCGTGCTVIRQMDRIIKTPALSVELLRWLDFFAGGGGPYHRRILELVASQPIEPPSSYPWLLKTLSDTDFGRQWFRHLLCLPFSKRLNSTQRLALIEATVKDDALAEDVMELWGCLFLHLLDPTGTTVDQDLSNSLAVVNLTQPLPVLSSPECCDAFPATNLIPAP